MEKSKQEKTFIKSIAFAGRELSIRLRPDADESVLAEIFKWREYQAAEKIIRAAKLPLLDVGAHIGAFSLYASALNSGAEIYALEPQKENFALLLENLSRNRLGNVRPAKVALSGASGERELLIMPDSINHRLAEAQEGNFPGKGSREKVSTMTFADFLDCNRIAAVGLLKMDIEGGEYEVFAGMRQEDFTRLHHVILEYHDAPFSGHDHKELERALRVAGFSVETFPSRFEKGLGFLLGRNKRL